MIMVDVAEIESRKQALQKVLDLMRPAIKDDGGDLDLVEADYELGFVKVRLSGACGSCALSGATLQAGVERILKGRLNWVQEVVGDVDDTMDFEESSSLGTGSYVPKH
jgi:Fe-S cluster biogenesis protein NfuA